MTTPSYQEQVAASFGPSAKQSAEAEIHQAALDDKKAAAALAGKGDVPLVFPDDEAEGGYSLVRSEDVPSALREGARQATPEEVNAINARIAQKDRYGGAAGSVIAGGAGALRGIVPFGLTDKALMGIGGGLESLAGGTYEKGSENMRRGLLASEEEHPYLSTGAELAGMAGTLGTSGGVGAAAKGAEAAGLLGKAGRVITAPTRAISALGRGAEKIAEKGAGKVLGKVGTKAAGLAAQGALEGGIYGASSATDESILGDHDLTAQKLLGGTEHGALFGVGLGLGLGAAAGVAGKAGEKVSGFFGQRAEKAILDDAAKVADRQKAIQEIIDQGATAEEAEAMYRANKLETFTTGSQGGDVGARIKFDSLGLNAQQSRKLEARLGPGYKVQLGEAMLREGITGHTVEELGESAEKIADKIVSDLAESRANIPVTINVRKEWIKATREAERLRALPMSEMTNAASAQQRYADALAKEFGLLDEAVAAQKFKGPKEPRIPDTPDFEKWARKEVGPEPRHPRLDIEKDLSKAYPRPKFFNEAAVREEMRAKGVFDEAAVNRVVEQRRGLHEKAVTDWNTLEERFANTANNKAKVADYHKAMDKWTADMDAAIDLAKEKHNRVVSDHIADYITKSEAAAKASHDYSAKVQQVPMQRVLEFRKRIDDVFREKGVFDPTKYAERKAVQNAARSGLEGSIMDAVAAHAKATGDHALYDAVATGKQRFIEIRSIQDILKYSKGRYASNRWFGLADKIMGAAGAHLGGTIGGAFGPLGSFAGGVAGGAVGSVASRYGRSHGLPALGEYLYKRSGADIGATERLLQARNVVHAQDMRMENAARKAIQDTEIGAKRAAFKADDKTMYRKAEALMERLQDPKQMQLFVEKRIGLLTNEAPMFATSFSMRVATAVHYLQSQMPKDREPSNILQTHLEKPRPPNDMEIARFARVLHAIDRPFEVLDLMHKNRLSRDAVQAVKAVYPGIYQEMRDKILEQVAKSKKQLSYDKLIQVGIMFDTPLEPSMRPKNVSGLQLTWPPSDSPSGTAGVNMKFAVSSAKKGPGRPPGTGASPKSTLPGPGGTSTIPPSISITHNYGTQSQRREQRR